MRLLIKIYLFSFALTAIVATNCHAVAYKATLLTSKEGYSETDARSGTEANQVGRGGGIATDNHGHALLWNATNATVVDLNPVGFSESFAVDIWDDRQVGWGSVTRQGDHALL